MVINIQYVEMSFSESLTYIATRKLEELSNKYKRVTKAKVLFKNRNSAVCEGAICKIELHLQNSTILADTQSTNLEMAVIKTIRKLKNELLKKNLSKPFP